jgi:uncharacterized flavoprotein (TIGR03862 family)
MTQKEQVEKRTPTTAVIGGGPAGLMAAEILSQAGVPVDLYEAMPSVGRKLLIAGRGGLNLTHSEPIESFLTRYGRRQPQIAPLIAQFTPDDLRQWAAALGVETFVGSSGRIFPVAMKASPLLRAWLARLRADGVTFHLRHRWQGWDEAGGLLFDTPDGRQTVAADATILALGGGSWAKLGSDGAWVEILRANGVEVVPLRPSNCGFDVGWSDHFRQRFAGQPVKAAVLTFSGAAGESFQQRGEFLITATGVEGSLIYAASALLRDAIEANGQAVPRLDLAPDRSEQYLYERLSRRRGSQSLASHWRRQIGLEGVKAGLLREMAAPAQLHEATAVAHLLKQLPLRLIASRPLDEAISSAGGVSFAGLDQRLMLRARPGLFCAGEMLDWEAPTGGYLLTACFASGRAAAQGALAWLEEKRKA